ncbi:hypothetical protein [uncultured Paenalcaligenes sp.]|uniref:hypothetical protein n=1 Tax=uncultured Paenalcaligenes sp. TaxID=1588925 RepID=UPI002634A10F|nr:hypothetical protein [uncultured Paenalcaligenes sp.]
MPTQHQSLIDQLQTIILQTITLIDRFEDKQMQAQLPADYAQLYEVLENSIQQQRKLQKELIEKARG